MITLRQYQVDIANEGQHIIEKYGMLYLAMQVRTGKTHTAMATLDKIGAKRALFITKKKAIASILKDHGDGGYKFDLHVTNYEQLGKFDASTFDAYVIDEAHCLGAFPKPSVRTKLLKKIIWHKPVIFLSGTPSAESYSQIYHQLYISMHSPYYRYYNFYAWAKDYVDVKQVQRGPYLTNDYSCANEEKIKKDLEPIMLTYTQEEAGFVSPVVEHFHEVEDDAVISRCKELFRNRVIEFVDILPHSPVMKVVADTPASLMSKLHQISGGTCITDNGTRYISSAKIRYIKENFKNKKLAIYYKFVGELELIKRVFHDITSSPEEFNSSDNKVFVSQISSGREGITLSSADCICFVNIDYSAVSYWQARARLQSLNRTKPAEIHWIFAKGGIEKKVYKAVSNKINFTASYFFKQCQF